MTENSVQFPKETDQSGRFVRQQSRFRSWVKADGSTSFPAQPGRYRLFVSLACPWAHRTLIVRSLKGLEEIIPVSIVDPVRDERGWRFPEPDEINEGFEFLSEAYQASDSEFSGRITVPVLWDSDTKAIVNNESSEIIRMLTREFDEWAKSPLDLYPEDKREAIDEVNEWVYRDINNGVYKTGFASSQEAYEEAFKALFGALDRVEERLRDQRYLVGDTMTEADWRLFTTLIRFDAVYHGHFKCNHKRLVDYPHIWAYTRDLYQTKGVAETVNFDHIKRHYYMTHDAINPTQIVPLGPDLDLDEAHGREAVGSAS